MICHEIREGVHYSFSSDKKEFSENWDIIVSGLGCAGAFCALSAAQENARVLGLERGSCVGGMSVQGVVNGYYYGATGGLFETVDKHCKTLCENVYRPYNASPPDAKKYVLEQSLTDSGVTIAYHSVLLGIYEENGQVKGVRALIDGTVRDVGCKMLVDATSDGHVLRLCGIKGHIGRETDGNVQPFSSVRVLYYNDGSLARTNNDSGYVDQYDDEAFSKAVIDANASHLSAIRSESERFLFIAPQIGIREGMRFEGEERLNLEDILDQKPFDKILLYCYSDIDKHGADLAFDGVTYQEWFMASNLSTVTARIPIPIGSIVPKGWKGLVSAGRCLSIDSYASSAVRMNRDMYRLGEACGIAIAMSLDTDGDVLQIDYPTLRQKLRDRNCFDLHPARIFGFDAPGGTIGGKIPYSPVKWLTDPSEIRAILSTETPGVAIWSCRRLGKGKIGDSLVEMMQSADKMLRYNAAIALGITGDSRALPVLREIVENRCTFYFKDCRRSNQMRSVIAIYLCGKLGDREIVPELCKMLQPEEFDRPMYHELLEPCYKLSIIKELNSVYFQHFSHAVAALIKIAAQQDDLADNIRRALYDALEDESYIRRMTAEPEDTSYYKESRNIKTFVLNHMA